MMKRISKILLVFVLLFLVGITSVYAAPKFQVYHSDSLNTFKSQNLITTNWYEATDGHDLCANDASFSCKHIYGNWNYYTVVDGSTRYISYCLNMSKDWINNGELTQYNSLDSVKFSDSSLSQAEKEKRIALLKKLLLWGYNPDPERRKTLDTIITEDKYAQTKLIAMQILVWEVMEGGRTSFDNVEPEWNGEYSFYRQVIVPNGASSPSTPNTLYYYYSSYVRAAKLEDQTKPAPAFNENYYTMQWDSANRKYKVVVPGIGDYKTCETSNNKVQVSVDEQAGTVTLISTETIQDAKITCSYKRGSGPSSSESSESFRYFRFKSNPNSNQDMVHGTGWRIYKASFNVGTENTDFAIKKVDAEGRTIPSDPNDSAKFQLTHAQYTSYSVTIDSNTTTKYSLNYSGQYRVREAHTPTGYSGIRDFSINIDAKTHKITSCDEAKRDGNGNVISCLSGLVKVNHNNGTIELTVTNIAKNFRILKVDKSNNSINGATFEIRNLKDKVMKFNKGTGNVFEYNESGSLSSLYLSSTYSYSVSLLPDGEYKIVETAVLPPYRIPKDEAARTTYIKVVNGDLLVKNSNNSYVPANDGNVRIVNYITKVNIEKTGYGNPLEGVQFELYNEDKSEKLKCAVDAPGLYTYVDDQASVDNYVYVTNSSGKITINNLPEGIYYFKEIYTPTPYVLPQGDGVYTKVTIGLDEKGVSIDGNYLLDTIFISNSLNSFNFYKRDTAGNALTTGKYKLQKYDKKAKKYVDLKLVEVENDGTYNPNADIYKVDEKNGKIQFTLTKGVATFIEMEPSTTYRIIETVAPAGYTKASTKDTATAYIDEYGNASGLLVLIDQKIVKEDDSAFAELIINIQTGKQRIMYAGVILVVVTIIVGLIVYNKKK